MLKRFLVITAVSAIFAAVLPTGLFAEALSDLNTEAFRGLTRSEEKKAPSSPFTTGVPTAEDLTIEDLVLSGTAINAMNAYALVSGYLVQRGDKIAGFRVDTIDKGRVTLRRMDEVYVLTIGGL